MDTSRIVTGTRSRQKAEAAGQMGKYLRSAGNALWQQIT
jgi:hypothetical protein